MHFRFMKLVDTVVGTPVCLFLTALRLLDPRARDQPLSAVRTILVTKYFGMGSIIMLTPMLRACRRRFPTAKICFFTFAQNLRVLESLNLVDEIITLNPSHLVRFPWGLIATIRRLRRLRPDIVLDVEFYSRFAMLIATLTGSPLVLGFYLGQAWRRFLLDDHIYLNHYRHITDNYMEFARRLGAPEEPLVPSRPAVPDTSRAAVRRLFADHGIPPDAILIGINPNASNLALERRWPASHFVQLVDALAKLQPQAHYILIGSSDERPYVADIARCIGQFARGRVLNTAGKFDFGELLASLEFLDLFVSNDSGPLHMAASLNVPTVSFFGPETPVLYGPVGDTHRVLYQGVFCSPCLNAYNSKTPWCHGNNVCLKEVSVSTAVRAVQGQLQQILQTHHKDSVLSLPVRTRVG